LKKIKKPRVESCDCGTLKVRHVGSKVYVKGGSIRLYREAVCYDCQERIAFAPRIILEHHDGSTYEVFS
jgi:hypothetical protein